MPSSLSGREQERLKRLRKRAYEKQGGRCYWCGTEMLWKNKQNAYKVWDDRRVCTGDHLLLRSEGGKTEPGNIVAACRECNNSRHVSHQPPPGQPVPVGVVLPEKGWSTLADVWPKEIASSACSAAVEQRPDKA